MPSTIVNGITFTTSSSGDVIATGPGIQGSGISMGYVEDLKSSSFTRAASSPNVDPFSAGASLNKLANDSSLIEQIKKDLDPPAEPEKAKEEQSAGQKISETSPEGNTSKEGQNKAQDDNLNKTATTTAGEQPKKAAIANVLSGPGKRTHNPLGDFSSYTYRISFYIIPPEAYNRYTKTGIWEAKDLYLICQSGGISSNPAVDSQRAPGFELDFYIDDLDIITSTDAKEVGLATNTNFLNFKVYEPFGATFPTKIVDAAIAIQQNTQMKREIGGVVEALWGQFLVSIRFYGYDENGQLISADKYNNGSFTKNLDSSATFERSFPVQIKDFKFNIEGKGQVYDIKTVCINTDEGLGTKRSTVSTSKSANGKTVEEVLGGQGKATNGIIDQLNKEQEEYVKGGTQAIADEYSIVFDPTCRIGKALIVDETINKDKVPMTPVSGTGGSNVRKSASAASGTMKASRAVTVTGGTSIVQAIDQIITQSSYVSDALKVLDSEEPQPVQQGDPTVDVNSNPKTLQWYIIVPVTEVKDYDKKRNDYAVKITYVIKPYDIPYVKSTAIKYVPKYPGPHKIYNYWYTGKNSEVISYTQTYDIGYHVYAGLATEDAINPSVKGVHIATKPVNNANTTGKAPGSFEGPNSIKTFLYSESDQVKAKITILGDPDFLMPATTGTIGQILEKWYGPDFTINPNTGQVFIELIFNQVEDYSNQTGTMEPNGNIDTMNFKFNPYPGIQELVKGTVFMVVKVKSRFSKGRFSQDFQTVLPNFADLSKGTPDENAGGREASGSNGNASGTGPGANSSGGRNQSSAEEQQRLANLYQQSRGQTGNTSSGNNANNKLSGSNENQTMPNDDQLVIAGPAYKKTYTQANFYNGDLEREQARRPDPANASNKYSGLGTNAGGGRGTVNPPLVNR